MRAALTKSCYHRCESSLQAQLVRLISAGFLLGVLVGIAEFLLKRFRGPAGPEVRQKPASRPVVVPYLHALSHNVKRVASKFDVPVVFSAPRKLSRLCTSVNRVGPPRVACDVNHRTHYVTCATGVVYQIPLSCGRVYIGQTGRCINVRAREHSLSLRSSPSGHLAIHCSRCGCEPRFHDITILARHRNKTVREIDEAFFISVKGEEECVSAPSLALRGDEVKFILNCGKFV